MLKLFNCIKPFKMISLANLIDLKMQNKIYNKNKGKYGIFYRNLLQMETGVVTLRVTCLECERDICLCMAHDSSFNALKIICAGADFIFLTVSESLTKMSRRGLATS